MSKYFTTTYQYYNVFRNNSKIVIRCRKPDNERVSKHTLLIDQLHNYKFVPFGSIPNTTLKENVDAGVFVALKNTDIEVIKLLYE